MPGSGRDDVMCLVAVQQPPSPGLARGGVPAEERPGGHDKVDHRGHGDGGTRIRGGTGRVVSVIPIVMVVVEAVACAREVSVVFVVFGAPLCALVGGVGQAVQRVAAGGEVAEDQETKLV